MLFANKGGKAKKPAQRQDGTDDQNNNNNSSSQTSTHSYVRSASTNYPTHTTAHTLSNTSSSLQHHPAEHHNRTMPTSKEAVGLVVFVRDKSGAIKYLLLQDAYADKVWTPPKGYLTGSEDEKRAQVEFTVRETGLQPTSMAIYENFNFKMQIAIRGQVKKITYGLAEVINSDVGTIPDVIISGRDHIAYFWLTAVEVAKVCGTVEADTLIKKAEKFIKENAPSQGWESRDPQ